MEALARRNFNTSQALKEANITRDKELYVIILTALPTLIIVIGTIAGNLLVCVAIGYTRQLRKNITNSFCASLAIR